MMSYFAAEDESMYLAISENGLHWRPLDTINPVLTATGNVESLRDPSIRIGADRRFHLLATNGWASTSIVHSRSDNLLEWSQPSLVPIMADVPGARNTWAPEFFFDADLGTHVVLWSSSLDEDDDAWRDSVRVSTDTHDHRIWYSLTPDFESWSTPEVWFDPGYTVIDATVIRRDGRWMLAYKDEREHRHALAKYKGIRISGFDSALGPFDPPSEIISVAPAEGPTFVEAESGVTVLFDHFLDGTYGGAVLSDGKWLPLDALTVPPGARHASVLAVDAATFDCLCSANSSSDRTHEPIKLQLP